MPALAPVALTTEQRQALTWEEFTKLVPYDAFARKTLENGMNDRVFMQAANYGLKKSGVTGRVQILYKVLFFALKDGPAAPTTLDDAQD